MKRLFCCLLPLLLCLDVTPAAAQDAPGWSVRGDVNIQTFDSDLPAFEDWLRYSATVLRRGSWGAASVEGFRNRRFGQWDEGLAGELYLETWSRSYVFARAQVVPDAQALPSGDLRLEVFQGLDGGWEVSAGARRILVDDEKLALLGGSIAKYLPSWYLRGRLDMYPGRDEAALFYSALARRYLDTMEGVVELAVGTGTEVVEVAAGPVVETRPSTAAALRAELFPRHDLGFAGTLSYAAVEDLPARYGGGVTLIVRW